MRRLLTLTAPMVLLLTTSSSATAVVWDIEEQALAWRGKTCKAGCEIKGVCRQYLHTGDTDDLNLHFAWLEKQREKLYRDVVVKRRVVIHPGGRRTRKGLEVSWSEDFDMGFNKSDLTISVWLGSHIDLRRLTIPSSFSVSDSGEIEAYIADRNRKKTKVKAD